MDVDFLKALSIASRENMQFCIIKKNSSTQLYTNIEAEYKHLEEVPSGSFVTGFQSYDSKSGHWYKWKDVQYFSLQKDIDYINNYLDDSTDLIWQTNMSDKEFITKCGQIIGDTERGNYFLINLTRKLYIDKIVDPIKVAIQSIFDHECEFRFFHYSPSFSYLSLSPERFISIKNNQILSQPIKGTAQTYDELNNNEKDHEENTMVVDLVRSDLARVCRPGTIKVVDFHKITAHPGLVQMNSSIIGTLEDNFDIKKCILELMPIASVTGTPKPRVLKVIDDYENNDRGLYCGALGWIDLEKNECDLSVAIRGIEFQNNKTTIGVGSGITSRSISEEEFKETQLKAKRLQLLVEKAEKCTPTNVFTSIFIKDIHFAFGYHHHINRLINSIKFYEIPIDESTIKAAIIEYLKKSNIIAGQLKLTIDMNGLISIQSNTVKESFEKFRVLGISVDSIEDLEIRSPQVIKTYPRKQYLELMRQGQLLATGTIDESIIVVSGKITESTRSNVFIRKDNKILTPLLGTNVIDGIFRQIIFEQFSNTELTLIEKDIFVEELECIDELILVNALRGVSSITKIDSQLFPNLNKFIPGLPILELELERIFHDNLISIFNECE
ncbi:MAG: chorismate-binding protein [Acidimicrobiia bacterium]